MEEEYIIKLKDEVELIPKEQWDGSKDDYTYEFIPLGDGIAKEYIYEKDKLVNIKEYNAIIGITRSINGKYGSILILYKNEKNELKYEWNCLISGLLRYEARFLLRGDEYTWKSILSAIITTTNPEVLIEFKKIILSLALGTTLYKRIKDIAIYNIELQFDMRKHYYTLYKYVLGGILDYKTYLEITELQEDTIIDFRDIDPDYIENLPFRIESALEKIKNTN